MGNRQPPHANGKVRPALHRSSAPGAKEVRFVEAANTLPIVAESYGKWRIAALEEDAGPSGAEDDPLDDVDLATYDEATVYDELHDLSEDELDFFEGQ